MIGNKFAKLARRCALGHEDDVHLERDISDEFEVADTLQFTSSPRVAASLIPKNWYRRVTQHSYGMWTVELWQGNRLMTNNPDVTQHGASEANALAAAGLQAWGILQEEHEWSET